MLSRFLDSTFVDTWCAWNSHVPSLGWAQNHYSRFQMAQGSLGQGSKHPRASKKSLNRDLRIEVTLQGSKGLEEG